MGDVAPSERGHTHTGEPANARTREHANVDRVRAALTAAGLAEVKVRSFAESTATAADAAAAIGTTVGRIVKSLVFIAGDQPILVLASGPNRVDTDKVERLLGGSVSRANADQVRQLTGFAIGGVPPVGHAQPLATFVDRDLLQYAEVWAAAGTPNTVFAVDPTALVHITGGRVEDIITGSRLEDTTRLIDHDRHNELGNPSSEPRPPDRDGHNEGGARNAEPRALNADRTTPNANRGTP